MSGMIDGVSKVWTMRVGMRGSLNIEGYGSDMELIEREVYARCSRSGDAKAEAPIVLAAVIATLKGLVDDFTDPGPVSLEPEAAAPITLSSAEMQTLRKALDYCADGEGESDAIWALMARLGFSE